MKTSSIHAAILSLIPTFFILASAQGAPVTRNKPLKPLATVEGITQYRLDNGLEVLLLPDPGKPLITVNVTYKVGSRNENYGETGMAHLLEHLLFKGTPKHKDIPSELTRHGARANGTTYYDRTNYYETFDATEENLRWALELESDRMVNSFVAKKDLDSEMTVVRNEFEIGENTPSRILHQRVISTAFLWHNYGKSTIGARSDIENVNIERLQAFYRKHYQPDNAVLLVAGDFEPAKALAWIQELFGKIPRPQRELEKTYTLDPTQDGERNVVLRRTGDVQLTAAAYHAPAGSHPDLPVMEVISEILANTPRGKLYHELVDKGLATNVGGYVQALLEPGVLYLSATARKDGKLEPAALRLAEVAEGLAKDPQLTADDVEKAKNRLLKESELEMTSIDRFGVALSEAIAAGDWRLYFLNRDRLRKITIEDVRRVAGAYLKQSNRTMGYFYPTAQPDRAEIPKPVDIESIVREYHGEAGSSQGEKFDPEALKIEARVKRTQLASGLRIALVEKKTRGSTVSAQLSLRLGDEASLADSSQVGSFAASMLMRGTSRKSRQQIQDELDRLKAEVSIDGNFESVNVSMKTVREKLPELLALVTELLREPAFSEKELETLRQAQLASLEQRRTDPSALGMQELIRTLMPWPKGHPLYTPTIDEAIEETRRIQVSDLRDFHRKFYGASTGELAAVGDFDGEALKKTVTDLLGDWKSPSQFKRITRKRTEIPGLRRVVQINDKPNAAFAAGLSLALSDHDPDFPALLLSNFMLGGGFLNSRLATRIRQKEGISYNVRSSFAADPVDPVATFHVFATYAPQNGERLEKAFKEEISRALSDGFTAQELESAKAGLLRSLKVSRSQDEELAARLVARTHLGRTLAFDAELEARIQALKPQDLTLALRRHLALERFIQIEAGTLEVQKPKPIPARP